MKPTRLFIFLIILSIPLAACAGGSPNPEPTAVSVPPTEAVPTSLPETKAVPGDAPAVTEAPAQSQEETLLSAFSGSVTAKGELVVLSGRVLDASGASLAGSAVEIWQVDADGVYDHPGDSNTADRDMGFQFYGTSVTDADGLFAFRTVLPGFYEPRPRHIHFKVKKDGGTLLTSQFYFTQDVTAAQLGAGGEMLLLNLTAVQDGAGNPVWLALRDIVINTGSGGDLTLTPSQAEGPYYPVIDVSRYDQDLASLP